MGVISLGGGNSFGDEMRMVGLWRLVGWISSKAPRCSISSLICLMLNPYARLMEDLPEWRYGKWSDGEELYNLTNDPEEKNNLVKKGGL